ncbi:hypothetical protein SFC15_17600 [Shouchella clausii]
MNDTVECPYCGFENDMTEGCVDLPDDHKFDHDCESCGKEFEVVVEFDPVYYSGKIEYTNCEICGKTVRDIVRKGRTYPFPDLIAATEICRSCWRRELRRERELNKDK